MTQGSATCLGVTEGCFLEYVTEDSTSGCYTYRGLLRMCDRGLRLWVLQRATSDVTEGYLGYIHVTEGYLVGTNDEGLLLRTRLRQREGYPRDLCGTK